MTKGAVVAGLAVFAALYAAAGAALLSMGFMDRQAALLWPHGLPLAGEGSWKSAAVLPAVFAGVALYIGWLKARVRTGDGAVAGLWVFVALYAAVAVVAWRRAGMAAPFWPGAMAAGGHWREAAGLLAVFAWAGMYAAWLQREPVAHPGFGARAVQHHGRLQDAAPDMAAGAGSGLPVLRGRERGSASPRRKELRRGDVHRP